MRALKHLMILFTLMLGWSCQDVIDLETDETTRALNVYGVVSDTAEAVVILTITTSYFEQGSNPPVNDAEVYLFEDGVSVGQLNASGLNGRYTLDYQGTLEKDYHIEIILPDTYNLPQNWASVPEKLSRVFEPDSFSGRYLDRTTFPAAFDEGYYGLLYFKEPNGLGDNYRIRRWLNDSLFTQEFFIFDDANFDGAQFGDQFPGVSIYGPMEVGDSLRIEISSLSRGYFEYLTLINEQVFQIGGPFDPPPSPIIGNIYNLDDPSQYGFGYFSPTSQSFASMVVNP
jgi:hypothetical protein